MTEGEKTAPESQALMLREGERAGEGHLDHRMPSADVAYRILVTEFGSNALLAAYHIL
jgi:hypothetical protein